MSEPLRYQAEGRFAATPEAPWPLVADTARLNRTVGLPPIHYSARPRPEGGSDIVAEFRLGRVALVRWDEAPFEWQAPRFYCVERRYHSGPIRSFRGGVELEAVEGGARVRAFAEYAPRHLLGDLLVRAIVGPRSTAGVIRQCAIFERFLRGEVDDPFPQLRRRRPGGSGRWAAGRSWWAGIGGQRARGSDRGQGSGSRGRRLVVGGEPADRRPAAGAGTVGAGREESAAAAGSGPRRPPTDPTAGAWLLLARETSDAALVERLRRHLLDAPDEDVVKMRPFALADRWGEERRAALLLFLRATTAGVLVMTWEVLCPHCRVSKATYGALSDLQPAAQCDVCDLTFDARFDHNVEVRFTVAPAIRTAEVGLYCVGGPMTAPHLVAQLTLEPGAAGTLAAALEPRLYELGSRQSGEPAVLDARQAAVGIARQDRAGDAHVDRAGDAHADRAGDAHADRAGDARQSTAGSSGQGDGRGTERVVRVLPDRVEPGRLLVPAGSLALQVVNGRDVPVTVRLERPEWPDTAATAALVSSLQEFRDLFSSEALAPGVQVAIQRLAFVFTDLAGSTALYQRVGQAQAFRLVQEHFAILTGAVSDNWGAVVKTIGDAVMATFPSAAAALEAALAIQQRIRTLDTRGAVDPAGLVKIGIHQGPCLAATANGRLDYFGTTVNVAARVEHACRGGEIALTGDVMDDPAVAARLAAGDLRVEPDIVVLRGIREPVRLFRVSGQQVHSLTTDH